MLTEERITFENTDKLDRERYADFLISLIKDGQGKEGSYTIAVDAPFGSGKTTFLKMLQSKIETEEGTGAAQLVVAYYNAWKYDYFDEPLEPLILTLMNCWLLADEADFERAKGRIRETLKAFGEAAKSLISKTVENTVGVDISGAIEIITDSRQTDERKRLNSLDEKISDLSATLDSAALAFGDKARLLVIIDELDRCRPDFAVKTLEITKHLLTSEHVVFLYAVEMRQLCSVIEQMYGTRMDSTGYILRFFDYISILPKADATKYLRGLAQSKEAGPVFISTMQLLCARDALTLRDMERIVPTCEVLYKTYLSQYPDDAQEFYIHLLCLKYKRREIFDMLFGMTNKIDKNKIEELYNVEWNPDSLGNRIFYLLEAQLENVSMGELSRRKKLFIVLKDNRRTVKDVSIEIISEYGFHRLYSVNYVLFQPDLERWNEIEHLSIVEYVQQRLEVFEFTNDENTVLPIGGGVIC